MTAVLWPLVTLVLGLSAAYVALQAVRQPSAILAKLAERVSKIEERPLFQNQAVRLNALEEKTNDIALSLGLSRVKT